MLLDLDLTNGKRKKKTLLLYLCIALCRAMELGAVMVEGRKKKYGKKSI